MSAVEAILSFDGKHVDQLKSAFKGGINASEWVDVASFFDHEHALYQTASTWLIKAALENAEKVPPEVTSKLLTDKTSFSHWEARLHFLQSIQFLGVPESELKDLRLFIAQCEDDKKTLVQVWALDAFVRLAVTDLSLTDETERKIQSALNHKAASMRARARNLLKDFPQFGG